ncbi:MAG TPA: type 4a pilus biogenesis protein PilO [Vicinamibacteria bacterium]
MTRPFWRAKLLPAFLGLLALNALAFVAWTLPRSLRQRNAQARAASARAELQLEKQRSQALAERAEAIRANGADLERFYATLAGDEKQNLFQSLEAVEELAREPGLQLATRSVRREDVDGAPLERVVMTLPLEGSYAQLVGFLRGVERSKRFLTVEGVALRADAESGGSLQVDLSTYLRQSPEARKSRRRGR